MGIFSKLFRKDEDEIELSEDEEIFTNDAVNQLKDEKQINKNTEPSPFLVDDENVEE